MRMISRKLWLIIGTCWCLCFGIWVKVAPTKTFRALETRLEDYRWQLRPARASKLKLVYLNIDTQTARLIGPPPWDRALWGDLIKLLNELGKVRTIGIDFILSKNGHDEARKGNPDLQAAVKQFPNVVFAASYVSRQEENISFPWGFDGFTNPAKNPLPELPEEAAIGSQGKIGFIDFISETRPRFIGLFAKTPNFTYLPFALELFLAAHKINRTQLEFTETELRIRNPDSKRAQENYFRVFPMQRGQLLEVNWSTPWHNTPYVTKYSVTDAVLARDWLRGKDPEKVREAQRFFVDFHDAIVLIGPTDETLQDLSLTPLDNVSVPRITLHGNALKAMEDEAYVFRPPTWVGIVLAGLFGLASLPLIGPRRWILWFVLLSIPLLYLSLAYTLAFPYRAWLLPIAMPMGCYGSSLVMFISFGLYFTEKQKRQTQQMFGAYVSPIVVKRLTDSGTMPEIGGKEEEITALFTDIEGFSSFSEKLTPTQLVDLMNAYLGWATKLVYDQQGTLDKYIGDAMVAMYNAPLPLPNHALAACRTALAIKQGEREFIAKLGGKWPASVQQLKTRIGLNSGLAVVGNLGSSLRFNYTMMGDAVNLAARCESIGKFYHVYLLVSDSTLRLADPDGKVLVARPVDTVQVVGRTQGVTLFELLPTKPSWFDAYLEAWTLYQQFDWKMAAAKFTALDRALKIANPEGYTPTDVLTKRCQEFVLAPPKDWTGCFKHSSK